MSDDRRYRSAEQPHAHLQNAVFEAVQAALSKHGDGPSNSDISSLRSELQSGVGAITAGLTEVKGEVNEIKLALSEGRGEFKLIDHRLVALEKRTEPTGSRSRAAVTPPQAFPVVNVSNNQGSNNTGVTEPPATGTEWTTFKLGVVGAIGAGVGALLLGLMLKLLPLMTEPQTKERDPITQPVKP